MTKFRVFTLIVLFATLVVLLLIPVEVSALAAWVPGINGGRGPGNLPVCICDISPPECYCGRYY